MRIGPRFASAFGGSLVVLLGGYGVLAYRMEADDLVRAAEREVRTLSRSAQVAAENALRDDQPLDVRELLERVEIAHLGMDLVVATSHGHWPLTDPDRGPHRPEIQRILDASAEQGTDAWAAPPDAKLGELALAQPLRSDDGRVIGALAVIRPLSDVHRDLERTRRWLIITSVIAVVLITLVALWLTQLTILRPLSSLASAMRRVRHGDMAVDLTSPPADDEVGALTNEFNEMVEQLRAAKQSAEEEAEKRRGMQRSLERADKLAAIGQLAAGLAHEIGTPLHVVAGRAAALRHQADEPATVRRVSSILVEQTERITRVVEQLLDYARQRPSGLALIDPSVPIRDVLELLEVEARRRGIALSLEVGADTPKLLANPDQLQQVALNLVRNSLRATSAGGRIDIVVRAGELQTRAQGEKRPAVRIEVRDDGCGIADEDRPKLFEPFFTTRTADDGTGLGLAVVRSIVDQYRGAVQVDSAPGAGAVFAVLLPVQEGSEGQTSTTPEDCRG